MEWVRDNPILYSKGLKEYKDTARKQRLWEEKARELDLESAAVLMTWYDSMRTRVGKLTLKKSGDGTKELTDRENRQGKMGPGQVRLPDHTYLKDPKQAGCKCKY